VFDQQEKIQTTIIDSGEQNEEEENPIIKALIK
jgi:hypothetical protein